MKNAFLFSLLFLAAFVHMKAQAQSQKKALDLTQIDPKPFADNAGHWYAIYDAKNIINALPGRPRYKPTELVNIGDNILLFQKSNGGWPKNYDVFAILTDSQKESVAAAKDEHNTTFDNGSTYNQVAALAIVYTATHIDKYKEGALRGLDFILDAQYKNGGWPQYYPLESDYSRHITFNDGAYLGIMQVLGDIKDHAPQYDFVDDKRRQKLAKAYEKGMDCILKTQINDAGTPTAWCQQYDEVSLEPAWARKFEPPSICNKESADLVLYLMALDHPSPEIKNAIENAVTWFHASEILYTRVKTIPAPRMETPFRVSTSDRVVEIDSSAPPIWTRYYELKTHRPMFCNRDSKVVYTLAEVARERRDGYGWYTYDPQKVLDKYAQWQKQWVVAQDGTGDFSTVQAAFDAVPLNNTTPITIFVRKGIYKEKLRLERTKDKVTLKGEDPQTTILTYDDHTGKVSPAGDTINTRTSYSCWIAADDFSACQICFRNESGPTAGQAVALQVMGDHASFDHCRFVGDQDVLFLSGADSRQYYQHCYIEGTTDFIFGSATAWFEDCQIYSKKNSFVTAASTPADHAYGFIFDNCSLKGDAAIHAVYLGRPWRPYASVCFMHCYIGEHILPEGWSNWNKTDNYKTTRYMEYQDYGPSSDTLARVPWSHQLTVSTAQTINLKNIFGDWQPITCQKNVSL